tara:strand:- start:25679 stop:25954 length:276 start_codon:yes stop_codon:yes gene_type:complete
MAIPNTIVIKPAVRANTNDRFNPSHLAVSGVGKGNRRITTPIRVEIIPTDNKIKVLEKEKINALKVMNGNSSVNPIINIKNSLPWLTNLSL